ncbi:MAG: TolC family protein [Thiovulaceae bacterium]|nr:TolC family protein [Sulfurimonadaceae bacterium]
MKTLLLWLGVATFLQAQTLDALITRSLQNHGSLKSIEQRLEALENEKEISRNFSDPEVSLTINDIQFKNPTDRTLEPMQFSSLNIKQKIPYFGKRDAQTQMVESQKKLLNMGLGALKTELAKEMRITAYSIWQNEQELHIIDSSIDIIKQTISLNEAYYITSGNTQEVLMNAELSLSEQKIKRNSLLSEQNALYEKLSYLAGEKIENLELSLSVQEPKTLSFYQEKVGDSSALHVKDAELGIAKSDLHIKELSQKIDPFIQAGYYYRENHPDYAAITVGASLPLYGTQKASEEEAKKLLLAKGFEESDLKEKLNSEIAQLYEKMRNDYLSYKILSDESMPKVEHLFELAQSSAKSKDSFLEYLGMLSKKLKLQEELIKVTADFNKTHASLLALTGDK